MKKKKHSIPLTGSYKIHKTVLGIVQGRIRMQWKQRKEQGNDEHQFQDKWGSSREGRNETGLQFVCIMGRNGYQNREEAISDLCRHPVNQERGAWSEAVNGISGEESRRSIKQDNLMSPKQKQAQWRQEALCLSTSPLHSKSTFSFLLSQADTTLRRIQTHFLYALQEARW